MALTSECPIITASLKAGNGLYSSVDPFVANAATPFPNGAFNPPGSLYFVPMPSQSSSALATSTGYAAGLWCKYVLYKSTANPATVGGPAPVYYVDETFQTVSGVLSEGLGATANSIAGWMLPNTSTGAFGAGAGFTNTVLNNGGLGSWVWIGLLGFIPGAISVASTAVGDALIGAAGNFTVARVAAGTAPTNKLLAWALTAVSGGLSDVLAQILPF